MFLNHVFSFDAVPLVGLVAYGVLRRILYRACLAIHILVQLGSSFRNVLDGWFVAAHKAARDDRYLIGEILLNYEAPEE